MLKYPVLIFDVLILVCLIVIAGMIHVLFPSELQWDLANYHYYNAWAFLKGRLGYDIAPAMVNTYFKKHMQGNHEPKQPLRYLMIKYGPRKSFGKNVRSSQYFWEYGL